VRFARLFLIGKIKSMKKLYNLYFWVYEPVFMATFENEPDAQKALDLLTAKYPNYKIWLEPIIFTKSVSFEAWEKNTGGAIAQYDWHLKYLAANS